MAHDEQWLTPRLQTAATLCNQTPAATVCRWRYASTGPM